MQIFSKKLYLFIETPHFIKTIDKTLNPHELYLIDIPKLEDEIIHHFIYFGNSTNKEISLTEEQKKRKIKYNKN